MTDYYAGVAGAVMLSEQIATDRMMDSFRRNREASSLALNDAAWRNQFNDLVRRYNQLVADGDKYGRAVDNLLAQKDEHISNLTTSNTALHADNEKLRASLHDARSEVAFLRALDKDLHPEIYRYR